MILVEIKLPASGGDRLTILASTGRGDNLATVYAPWRVSIAALHALIDGLTPEQVGRK